jgi:hypothetical protein
VKRENPTDPPKEQPRQPKPGSSKAPINKQQIYPFPTHSRPVIRLHFKFLKPSDYKIVSIQTMPERRQATATTATHPRTGVRRNLFHHQLSRRPTTSSTSTSAETLHLDTNENDDMDNSDIVIRNQNGEFEIGDPPMQSFDESEEGGGDTVDDESKRPKLLHERKVLI